MQNKNELFKILSFFSIPFVVYVFNYVLLFLGIPNLEYNQWISAPMHFAGGVSIAIAFFLTINHLQKREYITLNNTSKIIFVVSLVALMAVFWEFYQFFMEYATKLDLQGNLSDTMADLFFGILGGFLTSIFMVFSGKR